MNRLALHSVAIMAATTLSLCAPSAGADKAAVSARLFEVAMSKAERCAGRLAQLRYRVEAAPAEIAATLVEGLGALEPVSGDPNDAGGEAYIVPDRVSECRLLLMRAMLHIRAAEACNESDAARVVYIERALKACRAARTEYRELVLAAMGYLQESRIHRLTGNIPAAYVALNPLLRGWPYRSSEAAANLHRAAKLAWIDVQLLDEPAKALAGATSLRRRSLMVRAPQWCSRTEWAMAQAYAKVCSDMHGSGSDPVKVKEIRGAAAELLRREGVVKVAPVFERLSALHSLESTGTQVMTRGELLRWAELRMACGYEDVVEIYRRIESTCAEPLPVDARLRLATELLKRGDAVAAADCCDGVVNGNQADESAVAKAMQLRVAALTRAGDQPQRLAAALLAVCDCPTVSVEVRSDALRRWADRFGGDPSGEACQAELKVRPDLLAIDAYLSYLAATGLWRQVADQADGDVNEVVAMAGQAQRIAARDGQIQLQARSALLGAVALSSKLGDDMPGALAVLDTARTALNDCEATAAPAGWLRVRLLLELGRHVDAAANLPAPDADAPAAMKLFVAERLAEHCDPADTVTRGKLIALCSGLLADTPGDAWAPTARRCGQVLLNTRASLEAEVLLGKLLEADAVRQDPASSLAVSLMQAEAIIQPGPDRLAEADRLLADVVAAHPRSVDALLAWSRVKLGRRHMAEAIAASRKARSFTQPGSVPWCRATLALAQALNADGRDRAAKDILRVAAALHPKFGNDELKAQMKRLAGQ